MQPTINTIHECLGDLIFGYEEDELQDVVARLLWERGRNVFIFESASGTAGLISHWLAETNSPDAFAGAMISSLDLPCATDEPLPRPQRQKRRDDNYTLFVSSFMPATERNEIGQMSILIWHKEQEFRKEYGVTGHPKIMKPRAAKHALNVLRLYMLGKMG